MAEPLHFTLSGRVADAIVDPSVIIGALLLAAALYQATSLSVPHSWLLPCIGATLTLLSGWAWWRINITHMAHLRDFGRFAAPSESRG